MASDNKTPLVTAEAGKKEAGIPRATVEQFFVSGIAMMQSDKTREFLKDPAQAQRPGLSLITLQRKEWDSLGIDADYGCAVLDQIEKLFPGDDELVEAKMNFVRTAQVTYLQALRDRKPYNLEMSAPLPRATIFEFFDACNTAMDMPDTQAKLKAHIAEKGSMPNQIIIDCQRDLLEVLGFEKEHGCACLSKIGQDYPADKEMHHRFNMWQRKAQQTCMAVVAEFRQTGGDMPHGPFADNPMLARLRDQAKAELDTMTPDERGQLVMKMQKKIQVFMNLPTETREQHMEKLSEEERLDFVKAQLLIVSLMQDQWKKNGGQDGTCPQHGAAPQAAPSQVTEAAPQQEMM